IGDGSFISATGIGRVYADVDVGDGETRETILENVYYIPKLDGNLLSVPCFTDKGFGINFADGKCYISKGGVLAALAHKKSRLYVLHATPRVTES
ncbi:hypothetical protein BU15DRAFT_32226, partial [Melanogaster broomeanus]